MNKEEKIEEIISRHLFSYGYEREAIIKAMKEYAIAMCEEQKKECAENATCNCHIDYVDPYDYSAGHNGMAGDIDKQSILETKNVAE